MLEDCEGGKWLLNVTNIHWIERERKTLPSVTIHPEEIRRELNTKIKSCARNLFSRPLKRPPYIDTAEIHRKNIDIYTKTLPKDSYSPRFSSLPASPVSHSLTLIAAKLDKHKHPFTQSKPQQDLLPAADLKDLIHKIYLHFQGDETLGRYFASSHIQHLSELFYQVISKPKDYSSSLRIRAMHQGLGISPEVFTLFLTGFREALREAHFEEEIVETLYERMKSYEQDVVTL
jgi:truncated hemoglobin YjbI